MPQTRLASSFPVHPAEGVELRECGRRLTNMLKHTERVGKKRLFIAGIVAIRAACLLRFRPIMMTTLAALMGALPMAPGLGAGAELRQPLGLAIVGGLIFFTTHHTGDHAGDLSRAGSLQWQRSAEV